MLNSSVELEVVEGVGVGGVTLPNNVRAAEMTLSSLYLIISTWPVLRTAC